MKILAIETATMVCSTALIEDGTVGAEFSLNTPQVHSEKLLSLIDQTLKKAHSSINALDGIAVSIGPGSFTGLRIGLSVAKGLAFAHDKPITAVPTLKALAWNVFRNQIAGPGTWIASMIDARRNDLFTALYRVSENILEEIIDTRVCSMNEFYQQIPKERTIVLTGDGVDKFSRYLNDTAVNDISRFTIPELTQRVCSAASVGFLGEIMLRNNEHSDITSLEPMYVKDFYTLVKTQHEHEHEQVQ